MWRRLWAGIILRKKKALPNDLLPHIQWAPNWHIYKLEELDHLYGFGTSIAPHWTPFQLRIFHGTSHIMHSFLILHYSPSKWFRGEKRASVIKQHLIHLEAVKWRVFAHEMLESVLAVRLVSPHWLQPRWINPRSALHRSESCDWILPFAAPHSSHHK